ncbi:serine/threonine-protein phosphatase 6 regulatory ankyrin repeat subunit A, partial [Nilaparvata lugens]
TPLSLAVGAGNMYCVVILLEAQASVNIVDKNKHPPLFRAVVSGHKEVIELIVEKGGNLVYQDGAGKTALHLAAACGHTAACVTLLQAATAAQRALLLAAHDYHNCTPLHWACYNGHDATVQYLLLFSEIKSLEGNAFSPVHCSVYKNSVQCLELLVNRFGSQVVALKDKQQRTPLHIAALVNSLPCARLLLRHRASLEACDAQGRTPLVCAAARGHHHVIRALLEKKASVRACDVAGNTALHHACNQPTPQHTQCALLLLENTFDAAIVNMPNKHKRT